MEQAPNEEKATVLDRLPPSFQKFLVENGVDLSMFYDIEQIEKLPRYLRINPLKAISLDEVKSDLKTELTPVNWIPKVYSIPANMQISHTQAYRNGEIYGIDLSSCAVILALDPHPEEHILDLCCSPGSKLCYIADMMKSYNQTIEGSLTGVDINQHRLNVCKTLVKKYNHSDITKLYCEDGTTFSKPPKENRLYDKILVDAECTHDGSIKHLFKFGLKSEVVTNAPVEHMEQANENKEEEEKNPENEIKIEKEEKSISNKERKRREKQKLDHLEALKKKKMKLDNEWTFESFEDRVMNEEKLKNITVLQKNLVVNAFKLLKQDGILVYSTCSFIKAQNEDVVDFLINECPETKGKLVLEDVFDSSIRANIPCREGFLAKTVRFDPRTSNTGGMFITKLRKL